ncbi:MAG: hypothetical protein M1503_02415 [Thaumarchaeota archaeon]|nr:hypothetical protein [Nitrososphaerota archaeon]MCL5317106.1 hypothetical protein [Nitrososphaerota archaeon]
MFGGRFGTAVTGALAYALLYAVLTGLILYTNLDLSERFPIPSFSLYRSQEVLVVSLYPTSHLILCFTLGNLLFIGAISIMIAANIYSLSHPDARLPVRVFLFVAGGFLAFFTNEGVCGYPFIYALAPEIGVALSRYTLPFMGISIGLLLPNVFLSLKGFISSGGASPEPVDATRSMTSSAAT